jgi:hypothetical protein
MTKNEKCLSCEHLTENGVLISAVETKPNYFCTFKRINLNNVIVKNCTSHRFSKAEKESEEEFSPEQVFKNLQPSQKRINFFK